jgi:uncharacterized membrane protein
MASEALAINGVGAVTGIYFDANYVTHGFLRSPQGTFTLFDVPQAAPGTTYPVSINEVGSIVGNYQDMSGIGHGFLRTPQGTYTSIDVPGTTSTGVTAINSQGVIIGGYADTANVSHGFVRDVRGTISSFDPPGSTGTSVTGINGQGAIIGCYWNNDFQYGFVRDPQGGFISIDVAGNGTCATSINAEGTVVGTYYTSDSPSQLHEFLRNPLGIIAKFDAPDESYWFTAVINGTDTSCGTYVQDYNFARLAYVRKGKEMWTSVVVPGSIDTWAYGISAVGVITGYFIDSNGIPHSYLRAP